jgi:opacity protein-like surface antigen
MRKLVIGLALATSALASPALARDGSGYVGVEGGILQLEDQDLDVTIGPRFIGNGLTLDYKRGYDVDGIVGYDFGPVRAEVEVGYKYSRISNQRFSSAVLPTTSSTAYSGRSRVFSGMGNVLIDFGNEGLSGFVGAGVGVARTRIRSDVSGTGIPAGTGFSGTDNRFAWQGLAGVRGAITDNVDLGLKYRFFNTRFNFAERTAPQGGQSIQGRWRSHSLLASLIFNFGAPAVVLPPAPPPPSPPPPPPPATQTCPDGSVILATDVCPAPPPPPPPPPPAPERG